MNSFKFNKLDGVDKKEKFTNCSLDNPSECSRLIAVNKKFLAMSLLNDGKIIVVDSSRPIKIDEHQPHLKRSSYKNLDLEFSPFNNNILASSTSDKSVLLWKIPEDGLTGNITKEVGIYKKHSNKVLFVNFNPVASDVICSCSLKGDIHIWNQNKLDNYIQLELNNNPTNVYWNPNGSLIGATTKDKFITIFDPRDNKKIIYKQKISQNIGSPKFVWFDNDIFSTTSPENNDDSLLKLWDIRKENNEINSIIIKSCKNSTPFADRESKLLYIVGKEKQTIHVYDYNEGKFNNTTNFISEEPSLCSVLFDRKSLDFNKNEIDRFARYTSNKNIYYVSFYPDHSSRGNDNIYHPIECGEPALTYDEWIQNKNAEPIR